MIEQKVVHNKLRLFLTYYKIANPPKVKSINRKKIYTWLETVIEALFHMKFVKILSPREAFVIACRLEKGNFGAGLFWTC